MKKIQLEGRTIEHYCGRNIDQAPSFLARYEKGEGVILSEADIRLLGIRNFGNTLLIDNYWDTSTLSATKGKEIKVILPYEIGSRELTESARYGLSLINPNEDLINDGGVNLDVDRRWEKLEGRGVYTLQKKGLILNKDLKESQAMKHKLILTKLGHPDYVDGKFIRSADEVAEIIGKTFELGKQKYGYDTMMGQYFRDVSDKGILRVWNIYRFVSSSRARSVVGCELDDDLGQFAFDVSQKQ